MIHLDYVIASSDTSPAAAVDGVALLLLLTLMKGRIQEWDLFLDPTLVKCVNCALGTVDELELNLRKARIKRQSRRRVVAATDQDDNEDDDFDLSQSHTLLLDGC
jgi:hypothetical protein